MGFMRYGGLSGAAFSWPDAESSQVGFLGLNWLAGQLCGVAGLRVHELGEQVFSGDGRDANSLGFSVSFILSRSWCDWFVHVGVKLINAIRNICQWMESSREASGSNSGLLG